MFELSTEELLAVSGGNRANANGGPGGRGGDGSALGGFANVTARRYSEVEGNTANTTGGNGGGGGAGGAGGIAVATGNIDVDV